LPSLNDGHTTVDHINSTDSDTDYDMKSITSSDSSDSAPFSSDDQGNHHTTQRPQSTQPSLV
jgi:hypothetical protein